MNQWLSFLLPKLPPHLPLAISGNAAHLSSYVENQIRIHTSYIHIKKNTNTNTDYILTSILTIFSGCKYSPDPSLTGRQRVWLAAAKAGPSHYSPPCVCVSDPSLPDRNAAHRTRRPRRHVWSRSAKCTQACCWWMSSHWKQSLLLRI
jgi:hypothetical protein